MKVKSAMHKGVEWCNPETPVTEIAGIMKRHDIGSVPIGDNDKLVGMVTDRDIVCKGLTNGSRLSGLKARDVMTKGIVFCREDDDVADAVDVMEQKKIRRIPVINKQKRMTGMLSLGDVTHVATQRMTTELAKAVSAHH